MYHRVDEGVEAHLLRQIDKSGFHPDVIVCIGRGGAILGAILSGNLKNPDGIEKKSNVTLLGVDRIYSWENGRRHEVANEMVDLAPLRGKRVLLVSGDILSGGTMSFFLDAVRQVGGADTRTACLVKGVGSTLIPDFFGKEITASFRTPWMYRGLGYARDSRKPT